MGKLLAESSSKARDVFGEIDEALKQKLSHMMWNGPEGDLTLTENAQPAIMAVSLAVASVLEEAGVKLAATGKYVAGHSLGEYSALAAAKTFSISDAAKLLKIRGTAMQQAVPVGQGAMAALLGVDLPVAQEVAKEAAQGQVCVTANDNAPGQVVISGHKAAIDRAIEIAKTKGAKRSMLLNVSAPFHSPLMAPAADRMADALATVNLNVPSLPVVANVTASAVTVPTEIRSLLVEQVTSLVRWRESILYLQAHGVDTIVELGSGKVLTGLVKRIAPEMTLINVDGPADVENFLKTI
jgi:[acyl-carrier-protein] S-malonyltransferase